MLNALRLALSDVDQTAQVTAQVSDPVKKLLKALASQSSLKSGELMEQLGLVHRQSFRSAYLNPALAGGLVEMTDSDSPRSPAQMYRLTERGRSIL
ncbi:MAG: cell division protein Fic [Pseudomonas sp.]|nr:cell division protein Fic [Pseudomonas sp.]